MGGIDRSSLHLCNFLGSASRAGLCSGQLGVSYRRATGSTPSLSPSCSHPQRPLYEGKASNYSALDRDRLPILWNRTAESRFPLLLPPSVGLSGANPQGTSNRVIYGRLVHR